jgi:hypothetical protein
MIVEFTCYNCDGTGWQIYYDNGCSNREKCEVCDGKKKISVPKEMADGLREDKEDGS